MTWFEKIIPSRIKTERRTRSVPEGLWMKCPACDSVLYRPEVERNLQVCPKCAHHMRIGARERLTQFLDPESVAEIGADIAPEDPLRFRDTKRSPTTEPMEPPMNENSKAPATTSIPSNVPLMTTSASRSPTAFWAAARRSR